MTCDRISGLMLSDIAMPNWRDADDRSRVLQIIQPGLIGLIDGTLSTLAPIFAAAYVSGSAPRCSSASRPRSAPRSRWACRRRSRTTAR
jgi:hypothetical protein